MATIFVAGIGPGSEGDITIAVKQTLAQCDVVIGYKPYIHLIQHLINPSALSIDTGMKHERERALEAFRQAEEGKTVCIVSSGDAGIYGMASLVLEVKRQLQSTTEVVVLPGVSAFQKASALLGAPVSHDFCAISLSDLMTEWRVIERRITAAASADFVTAVYNPRSNERYWQLHRLREIFLLHRSPDTPVGIVRQAGREEQSVRITTLDALNPDEIDMFTILIIGNSQSFAWQQSIVTPRGYTLSELHENKKAGQHIMERSIATIRNELAEMPRNPSLLWTLLHVIHTTADFSMQQLLWMDEDATATIYDKVRSCEKASIVTDVTMVQSGIRKGALQRLGVDVVCYINDPRVVKMAEEQGITRAQASMRLATAEHPDALFAIGNAPTALLELCSLIRQGKCHPIGIVAAPVGFVHVEESKHAARTLKGIPKIIIEGRRGGSNIAATIVNSILTFDDAEALNVGRDV